MKKAPHLFTSIQQLETLITQYFTWIEGEYILEQKETKKTTTNTEQKIWIREPEPATMAGLALHLGFSSTQAFEDHEAKGKFSDQLKRARLRIMAYYEKKLHATSSAGAIFALKSMGWNESKPTTEVANTTIKVEIILSGPKLAKSENEVRL